MQYPGLEAPDPEGVGVLAGSDDEHVVRLGEVERHALRLRELDELEPEQPHRLPGLVPGDRSQVHADVLRLRKERHPGRSDQTPAIVRGAQHDGPLRDAAQQEGPVLGREHAAPPALVRVDRLEEEPGRRPALGRAHDALDGEAAHHAELGEVRSDSVLLRRSSLTSGTKSA